MDNLTHTLFAATLARTPLARAGRGTTAALLLGSNAPDLDIVTAARGSVSYLEWHRGPTHGLLGVVGLGCVTAALVMGGDRLIARRTGRQRAAGEMRFAPLFAVSALAIALHILMDLPTSYGTRLLSPFDWHWYAFDWLPIIDAYLIAVLAIGLIFASAAKASARRMTALVLVLMGVNYGLRGFAHHEAIARAKSAFASLLPPPCDPQRLVNGPLSVWPRTEPVSATPCLVEIAATPTFVSPFRWRIIARLSNAYELHELDLLDRQQTAGRMWRMSVRYPDRWTPQVAQAAATRTAQVFLGFSRFPAARSFVDDSRRATVRWSDMRFAGGLFALGQPSGRPDPFSVMIRLSPAGEVIEQKLGQ